MQRKKKRGFHGSRRNGRETALALLRKKGHARRLFMRGTGSQKDQELPFGGKEPRKQLRVASSQHLKTSSGRDRILKFKMISCSGALGLPVRDHGKELEVAGNLVIRKGA